MKAIDIGLFLRRTIVHEEEFIATQTNLQCRENMKSVKREIR
jgi:hypothetical protein